MKKLPKLLKNKYALLICGCVALFILCCCVSSGIVYVAAGASKDEVKRWEQEDKDKKVKAEAEKKQQEEEQKAKEAEKFNQPHKIGQEVKIKSVNWKVNAAKNMGQKLTYRYGGYYTQTCDAGAGNTFIKVDYEVKNTAKQSQYLGILNPKLVNSNKSVFEYTVTDVSACVDIDGKHYPDIELNPEVTEHYTIYFKVPNNSKEFRLKLLEAGFITGEGEHEYVGLGI
jgi:hypothetical protein